MAFSHPLSAGDWLRARRVLKIQLVVLTVAGAVLARIVPRVEYAGVGARVLYVLVLALFSVMLLHSVLRTLELLEWDCPRCHQNYCGPLLFRATCHSCGRAARESRRVGGHRPADPS